MLHPTLAARFGADLYAVFGPVESRKPAADLTLQEKEDIVQQIKNLGGEFIDSPGDETSFLDLVTFALTHASRHGYLKGIQLPEFEAVLTYPTFVPLEKIYKNNKVQRGLHWDHVVRNLLNFDSRVFYAGAGRMSKDGKKLYLNDAQHRCIMAAVLGMSEFPVQYMVEDDTLIDIEQYAAVNLGSLPKSQFDEYRLQRTRGLAARDLGRQIRSEDQRILEAHDIFERHGITVIESKNKSQRNGCRVLSSVFNLLKSKDMFGDALWERGIAIEARLFPGSPVQTANVLGICGLIGIQDLTLNLHAVDQLVENALNCRFPNGKKGSDLHLYIKKKWAEFQAREAKKGNMVNLPEHVVLAYGMWQIVKFYDNTIAWVEPTYTDQHKNTYHVPAAFTDIEEELF